MVLGHGGAPGWWQGSDTVAARRGGHRPFGRFVRGPWRL